MTLFAFLAPAFAADPVVETVPAHGPELHHEAPVEARDPRPRGLSVVAELDMPSPIVNVGLEVAVSRRFTVAGRLGLGVHDTLALYDMAGEARGYVLGDFDGGLFVGGGIGRTNVTPETFGPEAYTAEVFTGGKYTHRSGFTIQGSAGFEGNILQDRALFHPTARLGVGWTF